MTRWRPSSQPGSVSDPDAWLRPLRRNTRAATVTLLCFHHAGGSALAYRDWGSYLPSEIEPVAVQLPGRADRLRDPVITDQDTLLDALVPVISTIPPPYSFYGLSMGAMLAWSLACRLRSLGRPEPSALFIANVAAPDCQPGGRRVADRSDDELIQFIRSMGATPDALFDDSSFMDYLLATLRADLMLVDEHRYVDPPQLTCPIHGFAGTDDVGDAPARMPRWRSRTRGRFDLTVVESGHFFDRAATEIVTDTIARELRQLDRAGRLGR